jgi:hypothetical protein
MFDNDYNRQVERRQRIKQTTLVVGIDIGDDFNAVGFMNSEGIVLAGIRSCITPGKDSINSYE